jgi:AraC family ethanolamine operon transcriptional activator
MESAHVVNREFDSVAAFSESLTQLGWPVDFRQLDSGQGKAQFNILRTSQALVQHVSFDRRTQQHIAPPTGYLNFGIVSNSSRATAGGSPLESALLLMRPGGIEAIAEPGFSAFTLSFQESRLLELAENLQLPNFLDTNATSLLEIFPDLGHLDGIRMKLGSLFAAFAEAEQRPILEDQLKTAFDSELPTALLLACNRDRCVNSRPVRNKERVLRRALDYIEAYPQEALTVDSLCVESASSLSTLERAFRERFSMSPKRYMLIQRFHHVHRALLDKDEITNIAEIANNWGFWHMGKFAADYRKLFGYLPSETPLLHPN